MLKSELSLHKQINEHTWLRFTGIFSEDKKDSYAELSHGHGQMRVSLNNESGEPKYWFRGVVTQVIVKSVRGIYYLTAYAVSHSYLLDLEKKKRSFQNPNLSYAGLVRSIVLLAGRRLSVTQCTGTMSQGLFRWTYVCAVREEVKCERIDNTAIIGASIDGRIIQVSRNQILYFDAGVGDAGEAVFSKQ